MILQVKTTEQPVAAAPGGGRQKDLFSRQYSGLPKFTSPQAVEKTLQPFGHLPPIDGGDQAELIRLFYPLLGGIKPVLPKGATVLFPAGSPSVPADMTTFQFFYGKYVRIRSSIPGAPADLLRNRITQPVVFGVSGDN
jgi:hypothetical protein